MKIITVFQNHLNIFHWIGQSLIIRNQTEHSKFKRFLEYVPVVFVLLFHLVSVYIEIVNHYEGRGNVTEKTALTIYFIRMTTLVSTQLIVIIQIVKNPEGNRAILGILNRLCIFMKNRMDVTLSFHEFKRRYLLRSLIIVGGYLLSIILKRLAKAVLLETPKISGFLTPVRSIFHACGKIHALFYIELFNWIFQIGTKFIEAQLENGQSDIQILIGNEDEHTHILRHCKYVHFKLWKTMRHIERYFGWFLISIFLYSFIDILYSLCWLFVLCYEQTEPSLLGEYHVPLFGSIEVLIYFRLETLINNLYELFMNRIDSME